MVNRKKRLKKGIESIKKQIELHEEKKKGAEVEDNIELVDYYTKEIESMKKDKEEKERMLEKGGQGNLLSAQNHNFPSQTSMDKL